jgi:hypothetical protein
LGCAVLGLLPTAQAATATYSATHSPSTPDWSDTFTLQAFNPNLGSLQSVYIQATETLSVSGSVYNSGPNSESFTFNAGSYLALTLPGTLGFLQPSPAGGSQPYTLASGATGIYSPLDTSDSAHANYTFTGDLAWFIGTAALNLPGTAHGTYQIVGGNGNIVPSLNKVCGATVQVQYTYAPVPEPSAAALLALGAATLLWRRRR